MIWSLVLKGIWIGLIFGVPAGAIGVLTIQRTMDKGFAAGILTGLGSSMADLFYGCAGVFGITLISDFITRQQFCIQTIGGSFIILFGISMLGKKQRIENGKDVKRNLLFCFLSSFGTAVMNPATILSFMIAFTTFEIKGNLNEKEGSGLIFGIFLGTFCWWAALAGIVAVFRDRITDKIYRIMNIILGSFMCIFGVVVIIKGIVAG